MCNRVINTWFRLPYKTHRVRKIWIYCTVIKCNTPATDFVFTFYAQNKRWRTTLRILLQLFNTTWREYLLPKIHTFLFIIIAMISVMFYLNISEIIDYFCVKKYQPRFIWGSNEVKRATSASHWFPTPALGKGHSQCPILWASVWGSKAGPLSKQ